MCCYPRSSRQTSAICCCTLHTVLYYYYYYYAVPYILACVRSWYGRKGRPETIYHLYMYIGTAAGFQLALFLKSFVLRSTRSTVYPTIPQFIYLYIIFCI